VTSTFTKSDAQKPPSAAEPRSVLGVLDKEQGTSRYSFSTGTYPKIFGDRSFYGDRVQPLDDASIVPFLSGGFTIDIQADRSLTVTNDQGEITRLAWVEIQPSLD
jgi:hypothetical protein